MSLWCTTQPGAFLLMPEIAKAWRSLMTCKKITCVNGIYLLGRRLNARCLVTHTSSHTGDGQDLA